MAFTPSITHIEIWRHLASRSWVDESVRVFWQDINVTLSQQVMQNYNKFVTGMQMVQS